jgi:hypothetical protein
LPISETTVGVPEMNGTEWVKAARIDTPRNSVPRMLLIKNSVVRALRACGSRKMLTPFEMASVPVMAELPLAKARRSTKAATPRISPPLPASPRCIVWWLCGAWCSVPITFWTNPAPMRTTMLAMKKYVGRAKTFPASRIPRRLPKVSRTTKATESNRASWLTAGTAEMMASAPAATDTATVIV